MLCDSLNKLFTDKNFVENLEPRTKITISSKRYSYLIVIFSQLCDNLLIYQLLLQFYLK